MTRLELIDVLSYNVGILQGISYSMESGPVAEGVMTAIEGLSLCIEEIVKEAKNTEQGATTDGDSDESCR